jgi:hypothetical protein
MYSNAVAMWERIDAFLTGTPHDLTLADAGLPLSTEGVA